MTGVFGFLRVKKDTGTENTEFSPSIPRAIISCGTLDSLCNADWVFPPIFHGNLTVAVFPNKDPSSKLLSHRVLACLFTHTCLGGKIKTHICGCTVRKRACKILRSKRMFPMHPTLILVPHKDSWEFLTRACVHWSYHRSCAWRTTLSLVRSQTMFWRSCKLFICDYLRQERDPVKMMKRGWLDTCGLWLFKVWEKNTLKYSVTFWSCQGPEWVFFLVLSVPALHFLQGRGVGLLFTTMFTSVLR